MNTVNPINTSEQHIATLESKSESAVTSLATKALLSNQNELVRSINGRIQWLEDRCDSLTKELNTSRHECDLLKMSNRELKKSNAELKEKCQINDRNADLLEKNKKLIEQMMAENDRQTQIALNGKERKSRSIFPGWGQM